MLLAKRMKRAETATRSQEKHVLEIEKRNEILLLSSGPGGAKPENPSRYFTSNQVTVLRDLQKSTTNTATDPSATLNMLGTADATIED